MQDRVEFLKDLIRCRPVSSEVDRVNLAAARVREFLQQEGLHCRTEIVAGREVVYGATEDTKTPDVMLNVHLDVVPADPQQFEPYEKEGWLHGRGAKDCLGQAVVASRVLARLQGKASVGVIYTADEEIGGATSAAMVERGYGARCLILVFDGPEYAIATAQKGVLTLRLAAAGKPAHSSTPWCGENAIDRLLDGYGRIRDLFPEARPGDEWHPTLVAAKIQGGTAANRVPDAASMTINIRFTEPDGAEAIVSQLRQVTGLDISVEATCPVVLFDETLPLFRRLRAAMESAFGREIPFVRMNGATDARHFAVQGIPTAIIGVPGRDLHGADEASDIAALAAYEDLLTNALGDLARE